MRSFFSIVHFLIAVIGTTAQTPRLTAPGSSANESFRVGQTVSIRWDTTGTFRERWRVEFGKSSTGPWKTLLASVRDSANTRGAANVVFRPEDQTTSGYIRLVLLSDTTRTDVNDNGFNVVAPAPVQCDSVLSGVINGNVKLNNTKIYCLDGYVFVNGTLEIEPGTFVLGDTVGQNSVLCINRGGKLVAKGTPQLPIVFTSSARPGERARGDWGGVVICGKAKINAPAGEAPIEGGIADAQPGKGWYGGTDDADSSGVLEYARIEFAGIAVVPNSELNGLTMGAVGNRTVINNVQVSYGNDDAFEWFGGTVNHKNLIAVGTLDDDFDSDFGYSGKVQFAVAQRFRTVADQSTSQAFEQDNDAQGSFNRPLTSPVFSNVTAIGPLQDTSWTIGNGANQFNSRYGAAAQIRRNARTSIHNSIFMGWPRGIEIAQVPTMNAANADSLEIRNNAWFGVKNTWLNLAGGTPPAGMDADWIAKPAYGNTIDKANCNGAMLENPFVTTVEFNPAPKSGSPILTGAQFQSTAADNFFERVIFKGAFGLQRWDLPWAEYDPVNKEYKAQVVSVQEVGGELAHNMTGRAYPNPTSDAATIRYELFTDDVISVRVTDATGSLQSSFFTSVAQSVGVYEFRLVTSDLATGLYYVAITGQHGSVTLPVTVVR